MRRLDAKLLEDLRDFGDREVGVGLTEERVVVSGGELLVHVLAAHHEVVIDAVALEQHLEDRTPRAAALHAELAVERRVAIANWRRRRSELERRLHDAGQLEPLGAELLGRREEVVLGVVRGAESVGEGRAAHLHLPLDRLEELGVRADRVVVLRLREHHDVVEAVRAELPRLLAHRAPSCLHQPAERHPRLVQQHKVRRHAVARAVRDATHHLAVPKDEDRPVGIVLVDLPDHVAHDTVLAAQLTPAVVVLAVLTRLHGPPLDERARDDDDDGVRVEILDQFCLVKDADLARRRHRRRRRVEQQRARVASGVGVCCANLRVGQHVALLEVVLVDELEFATLVLRRHQQLGAHVVVARLDVPQVGGSDSVGAALAVKRHVDGEQRRRHLEAHERAELLQSVERLLELDRRVGVAVGAVEVVGLVDGEHELQRGRVAVATRLADDRPELAQLGRRVVAHDARALPQLRHGPAAVLGGDRFDREHAPHQQLPHLAANADKLRHAVHLPVLVLRARVRRRAGGLRRRRHVNLGEELRELLEEVLPAGHVRREEQGGHAHHAAQDELRCLEWRLSRLRAATAEHLDRLRHREQAIGRLAGERERGEHVVVDAEQEGGEVEADRAPHRRGGHDQLECGPDHRRAAHCGRHLLALRWRSRGRRRRLVVVHLVLGR